MTSRGYILATITFDCSCPLPRPGISRCPCSCAWKVQSAMQKSHRSSTLKRRDQRIKLSMLQAQHFLGSWFIINIGFLYHSIIAIFQNNLFVPTNATPTAKKTFKFAHWKGQKNPHVPSPGPTQTQPLIQQFQTPQPPTFLPRSIQTKHVYSDKTCLSRCNML